MAFLAHSSPQSVPSARPQELAAHLRAVAGIAHKAGDKFGLGEAAGLAGLLHDAGKYSIGFQKRITGTGPKVDHATAGAQLVTKTYGSQLRGLENLIASAIAGHHGGMPNGGEENQFFGKPFRPSLKDRLAKPLDGELEYSAYQQELTLPDTLSMPRFGRTKGGPGLQLMMFGRMLFSCLVDADYLDTEAYYAQAEERRVDRGSFPPLRDLKTRLDTHLAELAASARPTPVNGHRAEILAACRAAATQPPGLFSLTVPTGGGKTLSSLAFALDHAIAHELDRVIFVIPFTSIIEQTAGVFRKALGVDMAGAVLEHHSAFDSETIKDREGREKLDFAMENWDAPIVVTTSVQFFESLFANTPKTCRKLHNIARSAVILDEVQSLPLGLLRPCMGAIEDLARNYGASLVLCTATQPALVERSDEPQSSFRGGLSDVREIIPDPQSLYEAMKRVRVETIGPLGKQELGDRMQAVRQVLCIVNSRKAARDLFRDLGEGEGHHHLSALMCPRHRSNRLKAIRADLSAGRTCRVVSTSLVEAGVDVDFPQVYRAEAGIEAIAQAAGRCNREGKADQGLVQVFRDEDETLRGERNRRATAATRIFSDFADPMSLEAIESYFREVYWLEGDKGLDSKCIIERSEARLIDALFPFEWVARQFRMIESGMLPVIVRYDDTAESLIEELRDRDSNIGLIARRLQPYVVQIPPLARAALLQSGVVQPVDEYRFGDQFCVLETRSLYSEAMGLDASDPTFLSVEETMI